MRSDTRFLTNRSSLRYQSGLVGWTALPGRATMSGSAGTRSLWRTRRIEQMAEEVTGKSEESEEVEEWIIKRPPRAKLSPEEVRKRMEEFPKRREAFIASVRKGKS